MKPITRAGCVHVIKRNGIILDAGGDTATPQLVDGVIDEVVWFEPTETMTAYGVRETTPEVAEFKDERVRVTRLAEVEKMKSETAYQQKAMQARELVAGGTYDAAVHDFIALEVAAKGITALEAATAVVEAIRRDALATETARIALREELRT